MVSGYDDYRDRFYSTGGAMKLGHRLLWLSENMRARVRPARFQQLCCNLPLRTADRAGHRPDVRLYQTHSESSDLRCVLEAVRA